LEALKSIAQTLLTESLHASTEAPTDAYGNVAKQYLEGTATASNERRSNVFGEADANTKLRLRKLTALRARTHAAAESKSSRKKTAYAATNAGSRKHQIGSSDNVATTTKATRAAALLESAARFAVEDRAATPTFPALQSSEESLLAHQSASQGSCTFQEVNGIPTVRQMHEVLLRQQPVVFRGAAHWLGVGNGSSRWSLESLRDSFGHLEVATLAVNGQGEQSLRQRTLREFIDTFTDPMVRAGASL